MKWSAPRMFFPVVLAFSICFIGVPIDVFAQKDLVMIGLNIPLTGPYSEQGKDEKRAYMLAIDDLNSWGGVLDKMISYVIKDTQTNAEIGRKNALELIKKHNVVKITKMSFERQRLQVRMCCYWFFSARI